MIAIIDYDAGNIKSVEKALQRLGAQTVITRDAETLLSADRVILPGVGNFGDCMYNLENFGLIPVIHRVIDAGTPFLGICVGLQLLFESSEESPGVPGLGILKGKILRLPGGIDETAQEGSTGENLLKIPHMGWNSLEIRKPGRLFTGIPQEPYVYFVHSYYLKAEDPGIVTAVTQYGTEIHAAVEQGNVFATQFHPEKSSSVGLQILKNFIA